MTNATAENDRARPHPRTHGESHRSGRSGWLRAAVLGSDDAIVSNASLMIGVAASAASQHAVLVAGVAGLVAGAMSMAVGEYVSVSSQRDAEQADIEREKAELAEQPQAELNELARSTWSEASTRTSRRRSRSSSAGTTCWVRTCGTSSASTSSPGPVPCRRRGCRR